jgi:hypothetical protein
VHAARRAEQPGAESGAEHGEQRDGHEVSRIAQQHEPPEHEQRHGVRHQVRDVRVDERREQDAAQSLDRAGHDTEPREFAAGGDVRGVRRPDAGDGGAERDGLGLDGAGDGGGAAWSDAQGDLFLRGVLLGLRRPRPARFTPHDDT